MSINGDPIPAIENVPVKSSAPLKHQRVTSVIQASIDNGDFKPGDRLEGEVELAERLDVSRGTVRRALEELVSMGYITTQQGRGSFVSYQGRRLKENPGWAQSLLDIGVDTQMEILTMKFVSDPVLSIHLGAKSSRFFALDRVRKLPDGKAISLERSRIVSTPALEEIINSRGLIEDSLSKTMSEAGLEAASGEQWLQSEPLEGEDAKKFGTSEGTMYLHALRVTRDANGSPVEQVSSILDPTLFSFHIAF